MSRRAVGAVAHGGDLYAGFDGRGAPALDGVAHDDGAGRSGSAPRVVGGSVVDDDEEVNAGDGAAGAHGGGDDAANVVCSDDGGDALRLGTTGPTAIVHN